MIHFFGYYKETNHIAISSVEFDKASIFLRNKDFKINELYAFKGEKEINLMRENEEPSWVKKDHHIEINWMLSENDLTPFSSVQIELSHGGAINFYTGQLFVKFPKGEDIKQKTLKVLETMGYYAAEAVFEFCEENPGMYLMSFVLGKNSEDITDEFEKMKTHSEEINKDYI